MELGFDFTNELGVKVAMKTDIHPSSPTVAGECFVLQRRSCGCCSKRKAASMLFSLFLFCCCFFALFFGLYFFYPRIIKTISLYHETFTDPLQLPKRTPDQLLGLQLLYRKQNDLYAWKEETCLARSTPLLLGGDFRCKRVVLFIFRTEFVIR